MHICSDQQQVHVIVQPLLAMLHGAEIKCAGVLRHLHWPPGVYKATAGCKNTCSWSTAFCSLADFHGCERQPMEHLCWCAIQCSALAQSGPGLTLFVQSILLFTFPCISSHSDSRLLKAIFFAERMVEVSEGINTWTPTGDSTGFGDSKSLDMQPDEFSNSSMESSLP